MHLKYCTYFIYLWPWDYIRMTFRKIDSGPLCVYKWSRLHYLPKIESCILEKMLNNKCCHFKKTSEAFCWLQCGRIGTRTQEWMKTGCFWNSCLTIFSIHFLKSAVSFITPRLKEEKKIPRSVILITEERQKLSRWERDFSVTDFHCYSYFMLLDFNTVLLMQEKIIHLK